MAAAEAMATFAPHDTIDPALTPFDARTLLNVAFPSIGDLDSILSASSGMLRCHSGSGHCFSVPMPQDCNGGTMLVPNAVIKSEPFSPQGWQQDEWAQDYDQMMSSGHFGHGWTSGETEVQFSGNLQSSSWASDDMAFILPGAGVVKPQIPSIRTVPVQGDSSSPLYSNSASAPSEPMLVPTGSPSDGSQGFSSDSEYNTPLSATQSIAASLMPAIGDGQPPRRCRLSAKPSDAELKEAIAQLQKSTARGPPLTGEDAHTATRAECLERYREKKLRRLSTNTIRYMKRKINADRRPRIKGRFVKAEELDAYKAGLLPGQNGVKPGA